jgi:hypothetical protein
MTSTVLALCGPLLSAALLALNLFVAIRSPRRLRALARSLVRRLHRRWESVEFWNGGAEVATKRGSGPRAWAAILVRTRLGIASSVASLGFLILWIGGWVSPGYTLGFLAHLAGSYLGGLLLAALCALLAWSITAAWNMSRAQLYAAKSGLSRLWIAGSGRPRSPFSQELRETFAASPRIEILDFTGYELIAKGPSEAGGILAALLARLPDKEVRLLLFNPCGREIDPDRKHTTVLQSQLSAMEMSREAFESKLRATLDRIEHLNTKRPKAIEVRLYSEKPSFRVLVAGETAYLGAIDPRDAAGEFPLYEARRQSNGPSLHAAARAHFLRVWGDSLPVTMEAASVTPPSEEEDSETGRGRGRVAVA